jgi:hypothetical protein
MSLTHYYYALNRKAAERVFDLTWNQFLEKFGWSKRSQWPNVSSYFDFGLDKPELSDEPTSEEIAPILRRTIRETLRHMSPEYYCILEVAEKGVVVGVPADEPQIRRTKVSVIFVLPVIFSVYAQHRPQPTKMLGNRLCSYIKLSRDVGFWHVTNDPEPYQLGRGVRPSQAHRVSLFQNKFASFFARRWAG